MSLETPKSRVGLSPILVIEDNEDHLELTREALQEAGLRHPLHVAASLREVRGLLAQYALRPASVRGWRRCARSASARGGGRCRW